MLVKESQNTPELSRNLFSGVLFLHYYAGWCCFAHFEDGVVVFCQLVQHVSFSLILVESAESCLPFPVELHDGFVTNASFTL